MVGGYVEKITITNKDGDRKIFKFYPNLERTKLAFKLGEVNVIYDMLDPKPFDTWKTVNITKSVSKNRFAAIFFNSELLDKATRQALSYTIDKSQFEEERAFGPLSPQSWAYNPQVKPYDYDPSKAGDLKKLNLKLTTTAPLIATAEKIVKNWKNLGINVDIQVVSVVPDDYQAFLAIYDIPSDPDQYTIWHSTQTSANISKYKNPRIDKLLEDGRAQLNQDERKKIYLDFQRFLLEDAPAAFLYHPYSYTISRK
ncbi:MAG: ABC transporter substrate-binding protein [Patescibacteria group bacterium]